MAVDTHVHTKGGEDGNKILKAMDQLGLEHIVLMSRPPSWSLVTGRDEEVGHRTVIDDIARIVAPDPQRLIGFAWIEPTLSDAVEAVDYALGEKGLRGVKMLPNHWYPDDPRAQACYAKINAYGRPMLFHTGGLWKWGNTSKYCRPAEFEIMMEYPHIKFTMAHMSYPWTEECIFVANKLKFLQPERGDAWTCYIDISVESFGELGDAALRRAFLFLGDTHLMACSDCEDPENAKAYHRDAVRYADILRNAGASDGGIRRILGDNAKAWLGLD